MMKKLLLPLLLASLALRATSAEDTVLGGFVHTYSEDSAVQMRTAIPINASVLAPLLPEGYMPLPASLLGIGGPDQGVLGIGQLQGTNPKVDGEAIGEDWTSVEIVALILPPPEAEALGLANNNSVHHYILGSYTSNADIASAQNGGGIPTELVDTLTYNRTVGSDGSVNLVTIIEGENPLKIVSSGPAAAQLPEPLELVLWFESKNGTAVLDLTADPQELSQGTSSVYAPEGSQWADLLAGAGFGPCPPDEVTGWPCVAAAALNQAYPSGLNGNLWMVPMA